jgi:hypothetical protein
LLPVSQSENENGKCVELKLQDGTVIKIEGPAEFAAAVMTVILEVSKEKSSLQVQEGEPKESSLTGN